MYDFSNMFDFLSMDDGKIDLHHGLNPASDINAKPAKAGSSISQPALAGFILKACGFNHRRSPYTTMNVLKEVRIISFEFI